MSSSDIIIKARGLPWSATAKEVFDFFKDCSIVGDEKGIHLTLDSQGRPSGECFVELASEVDLEKAKAHDNEHMGARYIEVKDANRAELDWFLNRLPGGQASNDGYVRLRGLPYESTKKDIADFFEGINIAPYGITITMDQDGRPSGEAYVEFTSPEEVEKALGKNKEKIGHRYIEIFRSSKYDVKYVTQSSNFGGGWSQPISGRPGPYDRSGSGRGRGGISSGPSGFNRNSRGGGGPMRGSKNAMPGKEKVESTTGHMVHMRGLPFEATQGDIYRFFAPIVPVEARIVFDDSGRAKGECDVDFATHSDASAAMAKNNQNMGHRYIELFLKSDLENWSSNNSYSQVNPIGNYGRGGYGNMGGAMNQGGYNSSGYGVGGGNAGYSSFGGGNNFSGW